MEPQHEKSIDRLIALRLIRVTAATAMVLAVARFAWVLAYVAWRGSGGMTRSLGGFKSGVGSLLDTLQGPSVWFCLAGILYVLTGLARQRQVPEGQAADYDDARHAP